jgi:hypothetical protein
MGAGLHDSVGASAPSTAMRDARLPTMLDPSTPAGGDHTRVRRQEAAESLPAGVGTRTVPTNLLGRRSCLPRPGHLVPAHRKSSGMNIPSYLRRRTGLLALAPMVLLAQCAPAPEPAPAPGFGNGTFRVGVDIAPGIYWTRIAGCYWERNRERSTGATDAEPRHRLRRLSRGGAVELGGIEPPSISRWTNPLRPFPALRLSQPLRRVG